jgi:cell division protein FtsW (lipid II flippase)
LQQHRQLTRLSDASPENPPALRPHLMPHKQERVSHSPLALWHLLSLDAPTVAALWTWFLAHCSSVALPWTASAAMFVAVWMIYAADRLLDSHDLEARHHFHHRHRAKFLGVILVAAIGLVYLLDRIDAPSLHLYTLLATLLAAWLLLIHARPTSNRRLPKEVAVGLFFPAAVFIPTVARAPALRAELLPAAALLASVCILNCLFLYAWEHPHDRSQAHNTTRWATGHLIYIAASVSLLCTLSAIIARAPCLERPALACAISSALLILLHLFHRHLSPIHLRAAADVALLSPLLLIALH